ncbi:MAG: copper chaperone PCu(A)C [Alphaproteobacteria bacterium]
MRYLFTLGLALLLCPLAMAQAPKAADALEVQNPWVRATPASANVRTSAAYMVLKNNGDADIDIVGASSTVAERVELHTHTMTDNGVMTMTKIEKIVVPAGHNVALESGGHHIMFFNLAQPLVEGTEVDITLQLAGGHTRTVRAKVMPVNFNPAAHHHHH